MDTVFRQIVARSTPNRRSKESKRKGEREQQRAKRKGRIFIRPGLENKIFSPRCGVADLRLHYTHSNRVLHLTNVDRVTQALFPASHQYWGQCSNCRRAPCGGTSYT